MAAADVQPHLIVGSSYRPWRTLFRPVRWSRASWLVHKLV